MQQKIAIGKRVQVINQDIQGNDVIEGYAIILDISDKSDNRVYCYVKFETDGYETYRWINMDVQP